MAEPSFPYNPLQLPGKAFTLWLPPKPPGYVESQSGNSAGTGRPLTLPGQAFTLWTLPRTGGLASSAGAKPSKVAGLAGGSATALRLPGGQFTLWTREVSAPAAPSGKTPGPVSGKPVTDPGILRWAALLVALAVLAFAWTKNRDLTAEIVTVKRAAESDRTAMEGQLAATAKLHSAARQQVNALQASLTEMENSNVALADEKQKLEQKVKALNDQATAAKRDAENRAGALQQSLDVLTKEKLALQGTADARKTETEKTQATLAETQKSLKQAQEKLTSAEKQVTEAKAANDQVRKESEQIKADAEKMKANVEAATRDKEELRKSVEALVTTIKELEKALADAKKAASGQ
ncbi:MAG: hypothetical protein ACR2OZ_15370 [Verrucomicrobiales bacterium]